MTEPAPAVATSTPPVSAIRLNECPLPSARTRSAPATTSWSSARPSGEATSDAENSMLRAQFIGFAAICSTHRRPLTGPERHNTAQGDGFTKLEDSSPPALRPLADGR